MDSKTLKVACLTAVLMSIMVIPRAANAMIALPYFHYEMYVDSTWEMYNSYVVFHSSGHSDEYFHLGSLVSGHLEVPLYNEPDSYYVVGVYGPTTNQGAVVSFNKLTTPGIWESQFTDPEVGVISWCNAGSMAPLNSSTSLWTPIASYLPTPSYSGLLFGFSNPENAGRIEIMRTSASVPEASTFVGLLTAALSMLGFRRFKK